jgi:hypothetical protein
MKNHFLPYLQDMLAMGVPEQTAMQWHNAICLIKSHAEHLTEVIENQIEDHAVLEAAAALAREAMSSMRPRQHK